MADEVITICGTVCDFEFDKSICKFSNNLDVEDARFFSECLYKNNDGVLYLHITWGRHFHSSVKDKLIKTYGKMYEFGVNSKIIFPLSIEECNTWLAWHGVYKGIEGYILGGDIGLDDAMSMFYEDVESEEF